MPLQSADASPLRLKPVAGSRLAATVSIPKASTVAPVHGAPRSRVSACTQMSRLPPETGFGLNGYFAMLRARLCRWTDWRHCRMEGSDTGLRLPGAMEQLTSSSNRCSFWKNWRR